MSETPFNQEEAITRYIERMRLASAGESAETDELEYQAALRGLHFVKVLKRYATDEQRYELQAMTSEQMAAFTRTLTDEIEALREITIGLLKKTEVLETLNAPQPVEPEEDPFEQMTHDDFVEALQPQHWKEVYQRLHTPTFEAILQDGRLTLLFPDEQRRPFERSDVEALTRFLDQYAGVEPLAPPDDEPFPVYPIEEFNAVFRSEQE